MNVPKFAAVLPGLVLIGVAAIAPAVATAASPANGSIGPDDVRIEWDGTAIGGSSAGEETCVEGVNCDTFTITVLGTEADWADKLIRVDITWLVPATDYDLYIHKDSNDGPIVGQAGDAPPETIESAAIVPASDGVGVYTVRVVYFAAAADQYRGTASVASSDVGARQANYVKGGIDFSDDFALRAPTAAQDGEPSNRTDQFGNHYTGAIRGVPAGVDLWYFDLNPDSPTYDPLMRNPIYRGQPDEFVQDDALSVGADGGGDIDLAVGFDHNDPSAPPTLAYSSLVAANISTGKSEDLGETFLLNPAGNVTGGVPGDDRQWLEFFGPNEVYLLYRTLAPAVTQIQRSLDGGLTYGPAATAGAIGQVGSIDVHQGTGDVYISGSSGQVCVGSPPAAGLAPVQYNCAQAASDPNGVNHIFFVVKVADDGTENGTAYVAYSNQSDIFIAHSKDKGATWSAPVRVSDGPETATSVFPWIETGPTPGSVGVVWYGTDSPSNNNDANWNVFYALSHDADQATPTFRQVQANNHFIHGSNISEGGLDVTGEGANRNLIDYFQLSFDPHGAVVISYTDDHNDFSGHTYVTRQISGPSIYGADVPAPVEGAALPAPVMPSPDAPEVVDFRQDMAIGLLAVVPLDDPLDVVAIDYSCELDETNGLLIVAEMEVSDLSIVPELANWRMNFTANAPFGGISPTGDYSFALSDRGDQFWVRASTDPNVGQFTWGTAVRQGTGAIAYTTRGPATAGSFDPANNTITVKIAASELNAFVQAGPEIDFDSVLAGLRGQTFTSQANAKRDITRGGTEFALSSCDPDDDDDDNNGGGNNDGAIIKATGGGKILGKTVQFSFNAHAVPSGHVNYMDRDLGIHLVSESVDVFAETGSNEVTFSGTGRVDRDPVAFTITVRDNGEPGRDDYFSIDITGAVTSSREGQLDSGNIQVHR